ncbi:MAG: hypothetical protein ACE5F6_06700 [Anaerolineae bacterium]
MTTVRIDKSSAIFYIRPASERYQGCYYFCPTCADARGAGFLYLEASRAWEPCRHDRHAAVPTLRPNMELRELFDAFIQDLGDVRRNELYSQEQDVLSPDDPRLLTAEERRQWDQRVQDARIWLAEQWRLALNDRPNDLGWTARDVWGARRDERGNYSIHKPEDTEFLWAEG